MCPRHPITAGGSSQSRGPARRAGRHRPPEASPLSPAQGGCRGAQGLGAASPPPTNPAHLEHLGAAPASIPLPGNGQSEVAGPLPWQPPVAIAAADGGAGDGDGGRGDSGGRRGDVGLDAQSPWQVDTRLVDPPPPSATATPPRSPWDELIPRNGAGCTPGGWLSPSPPPQDPLSLCPTSVDAITPQDHRPYLMLILLAAFSPEPRPLCSAPGVSRPRIPVGWPQEVRVR